MNSVVPSLEHGGRECACFCSELGEKQGEVKTLWDGHVSGLGYRYRKDRTCWDKRCRIILDELDTMAFYANLCILKSRMGKTLRIQKIANAALGLTPAKPLF